MHGHAGKASRHTARALSVGPIPDRSKPATITPNNHLTLPPHTHLRAMNTPPPTRVTVASSSRARSTRGVRASCSATTSGGHSAATVGSSLGVSGGAGLQEHTKRMAAYNAQVGPYYDNCAYSQLHCRHQLQCHVELTVACMNIIASRCKKGGEHKPSTSKLRHQAVTALGVPRVSNPPSTQARARDLNI